MLLLWVVCKRYMKVEAFVNIQYQKTKRKKNIAYYLFIENQ